IFVKSSFRLNSNPVLKTTRKSDPGPPEPPSPPSPPPDPPEPTPPEGPSSQEEVKPDESVETPWHFCPLDPLKTAGKACVDLFPPNVGTPPPAKVEVVPPPAPDNKNASPQVVVQLGEQSTRHGRFANATSFGPVLEHAIAGSAGVNFPLHPEGKAGLELQIA